MPKKRAGAKVVTRDERKRGAKTNGLSVTIVGAGRLGTALALGLAGSGYRIEAVVARAKSSARKAARLIPTKPLALAASELERLPASDLLFITTPDDLIYETAARISALPLKAVRGRVALHASGALSSAELKSLREKGWATASMHPLISVSDAKAGALSLSRAFFCIEGEARAVNRARVVVRSLGARSFHIKTENKALYHAAAVMASGHMVALFDVASEMLARCGLTLKQSRAILMPLVESTLANLRKQEPARALTGTFARADVATVQRHLDAIRHAEMSEALAAYALLGRRSLRLARERGIDGKLLKAIRDALDETIKNKR